MSTTTSAGPSRTIQRGGSTAAAGGVLWVLLPVATAVATFEEVDRGSLPFVAVAVSFVALGVLPPLLLLSGLSALREALGECTGRLGTAGLGGAALGFLAMAVGLGTEVTTMVVNGEKNAAGYVTFLVGFLVLMTGSAALGVSVLRRHWDGLSRAGSLLLVLALPAGIGVGLLGSAIAPDEEAWFFAAVTVPTGLAWLMLGRSLARTGTGRR